MVNQGTKNITLRSGNVYQIPEGYHNGNGRVSVSGLSEETNGTAIETDIIAAKTAWVNGVKLVGSMIDYSNQTIPRDGDTNHIKGIENYWETATGKGSDIVIDIPQIGYFKNTKITQAIYGVHPDIIKYGAVIGSNPINENGFNIKGTFTGDGTAVASQIIKGVTAYVKGNKVTGTLSVNSALSFSAAAISSTEIEIYWTNPAMGPFNGVFVQMGTGGYPGVNGGTRVYTGIGTNSAAGGRSSCKITGLQPNTTYYFTACSYCDPLPWPDGTNLSAKTGSAGTKIFTSSQSWTIPADVKKVDVFLVSGGCCGGDNGDSYFNICGGSGGYTQTYTNVDVSSINTINIIVGAGSRVSYTNENGGNKGGESSFGAYKVIGGSMIKISSVSPVIWQNRGGSGGGDRSVASITSATTIRAGNGGADGTNGTTNRASNVAVSDRDYGKGQTITTRAFKEPSGTLYASGGGGGGSASRAQSSIEYTSAHYGSGGIGGGGNGGNNLTGTQSPDPSELYLLNAQDGTPNTGSGGGGAGKDSWAFKVSTGFKTTIGVPGKGGSGIVIIRWR